MKELDLKKEEEGNCRYRRRGTFTVIKKSNCIPDEPYTKLIDISQNMYNIFMCERKREI